MKPWMEDLTCEELEKIAFESHTPCYLEPEGIFGTSKICLLNIKDCLRVFWTIKSAFYGEFYESVKGFFEVCIQGCGKNILDIYDDETLAYLGYMREGEVDGTITIKEYKKKRSIIDNNEELAHFIENSLTDHLKSFKVDKFIYINDSEALNTFVVLIELSEHSLHDRKWLKSQLENRILYKKLFFNLKSNGTVSPWDQLMCGLNLKCEENILAFEIVKYESNQNIGGHEYLNKNEESINDY
jgi:hypothetical protein